MNEEIVPRIQAVIDYYNLTVSAFADRIGVQRSSISHLLSGRNKPSLDFVMKLAHAFPDVDLYWLLKGEGDFPSTSTPNRTVATESPQPTPEASSKAGIDIPLGIKKERIQSMDPVQIVMFYPDGSFQSFHPKND